MPCILCKTEGHTPSKCACLRDVLKEGFYSGGGAGGGHDHGDDDEHVKLMMPRLLAGTQQMRSQDERNRLCNLLRAPYGGNGSQRYELRP